MFDWVLNTPLHFLTHPMENIKRFADISLEQEFQGKPKQGKPKHILLFFVMELTGSVQHLQSLQTKFTHFVKHTLSIFVYFNFLIICGLTENQRRIHNQGKHLKYSFLWK